MGLFAILRRKSGNILLLLDEFYHDERRKVVGIDDEYIIDKVEEMLLRNNIDRIHKWFVPHDAPSLRNRIRKKTSIRPVTYTPNILDDIERVKELIKYDRFYIHNRCRNSIKSINTYSWDEKKALKGETVPDKFKNDDHCPDMFRGACHEAFRRKVDYAELY